MASSLSSRDIVRRCIRFQEPPRIAMHFHTYPIDGCSWPVSDFAMVGYAPDPTRSPRDDGTDEWGLRRRSFDATGEDMGQVLDHPLAEGWDRLESYPFPDFEQPGRYVGLADRVARLHDAGYFVYGSIPSLMLLPQELRGMENWYVDQVAEQAAMRILLDKILKARFAIIRQYAAAGVDAVITWDDMGDNERPLVSPQVFTQLYLEPYRRTCDLLHEHDMAMIHHCCGQVRMLLGLLIDAGCDVLQLDQPRLMGVDWLSEHAGGRVCFWNSLDVQRTLPSNDPHRIELEACEQIWKLGRFGGGFMFKAYQQPNSIGLSAAAAEAQFHAVTRHGRYPLLPWSE